MSTGHADHRAATPMSAHLGLLVVQLCFGTFPIAGKWAMGDGGFAPMAVATWRVFVGAGVLLVLARLRHPSEFRLSRRDAFMVFWLGLLGIALNQMLYIKGLSMTSATHAALMMGTAPVMTYLIAALLGRERWLTRKVLGVSSALLGVIVLFIARDGAFDREHVLGDVLVLINSLSYSTYLVLAKPILTRKPPFVVISWVFFVGAVVVPCFSFGETWWPDHAAPQHWWALAWILVFPTVLAYVVNLKALGKAEASLVAIYICLQPVISMLLAAVLLGEQLRWAGALTLALVLNGVWWVSQPARRRQPQPTLTAR